MAAATFLAKHKIMHFPPSAPEADFQRAVAKFTKMEESVIASGNKLVEYYKTVEQFAGGMGAGPQAFSVACAPPGANLFSSGAAEVEYAFKQLASKIEKTILPSILKKAVAMDQVYTLLQQRMVAKWQSDYYSDKYKTLKKKGTESNGELSNKQKGRLVGNKEKMTKAKSEVKALTNALVAAFRGYEAIGVRILQFEFEQLKTAETQVATVWAAEMSKLPMVEVAPVDLPQLGGGASPTGADEVGKEESEEEGDGGDESGEDDSDEDAEEEEGPSAAPVPPPIRQKASGGATHVAVYDFDPEDDDELPFEEGDHITVTDTSNDEWWKGTCNGKSGVFPSNYVEPL